ncbi:hypothetical protein C4577_05005 [Candidatus Parcubacteria bacterium]|nr:MAG: hypothetical protein C4577_05005 [Candidatus Parcubacteria bacterium]
MADRTSAAIFGDIFNMLASDEPIDKKQMALKVWEMSGEYDFTPYQMYCDDALIELGLARKGVDPECPEDGFAIQYGPKND